MDAIDQAIGAVVHGIMWDKQLQQIDVGPRSGMTQTTLSKKLRGQRPWSAEDIVKVAAAIGEDPADVWSQAMVKLRAITQASLPKASGQATGPSLTGVFRNRLARRGLGLCGDGATAPGMARVLALTASCPENMSARVC